MAQFSLCILYLCTEVFVAHTEHPLSTTGDELNESTAGADASVEALKLYHMKLTLAYSE